MTEGREWFETLIGETVYEVRDLQDKSLAPIGAQVAQVRENAKLARTVCRAPLEDIFESTANTEYFVFVRYGDRDE